jgi:hypothetical protein
LGVDLKDDQIILYKNEADPILTKSYCSDDMSSPSCKLECGLTFFEDGVNMLNSLPRRLIKEKKNIIYCLILF